MKENKILASVALFSELYNNKKDIYDVIAEFVKASIISEAKWSFTGSEASFLLEKTFDFKLPDGVVKSVLKNRLKRDGIVSFENGIYSITSDEIKQQDKLKDEFNQNQAAYSRTFQNLVLFVENKLSKKLIEKDVNDLYSDFNSYLLENTVSEKYSKYISFFIIENKGNPSFTESLNAIKEGLVLYTGIRYTTDLNDLGSWNSELTIFLDAEHLFNALGYNGILYAEIFDDFYNLVQDINLSNRIKGGKKKIELMFFEETKTEIDSFFYVGEKILEGKASLNPAKTAMQSIVNGCKTPSEIVAKKSSFYQELSSKGINVEQQTDYYKNHTFIVEGGKVLENLEIQSKEKKRHYDEEEFIYYLKLFTKVNSLRKGISNNGFERIGFILLSGSGVAHYLAHSNLVKVNEKDIPFATDIDFVTDKFWFKLKKGFSDKTSLPKSFDIITKAQIVLSAQLKNTVSEEYVKLTEKYKAGEISKEQAISLNYDLRERAIKPEEIDVGIVDDSLAFLNNDNVEKLLQERTLLLEKLEEGENAKKELRRRKTQEQIKKKRFPKIKTLAEFYCLYLPFHFLLIVVMALLLYLIYKLSKNVTSLIDSLPDIISLCFLICCELIPLLKYKSILKWINRRYKDKYRNLISNLNTEGSR